jgi:hypothetical protein
MAHFARVSPENIVTGVDVVDNKNLLDENGVEQEAIGIAYLNSFMDISPNKWVQCSYNNNFRKQYPGIGYTYDETNNVFIVSKPYDSWTLDSNFDYQPPVAFPLNHEPNANSENTTHELSWKEDLQRWEGKRYSDAVDQIWNSTTLIWENKN